MPMESVRLEFSVRCHVLQPGLLVMNLTITFPLFEKAYFFNSFPFIFPTILFSSVNFKTVNNRM